MCKMDKSWRFTVHHSACSNNAVLCAYKICSEGRAYIKCSYNKINNNNNDNNN